LLGRPVPLEFCAENTRTLDVHLACCVSATRKRGLQTQPHRRNLKRTRH
jgi:hypothetical protein